MIHAILAVIVFLSTASAEAGPRPYKFVVSSTSSALSTCTPGTDCYCDCVTNATKGASSACTTKWGANIFDASLIFCEDSEAPPLWDFANHLSYDNDGAPYYGPAYDDNGFPNLRGENSYWKHTYGYPNAMGAWRDGQPASPTYGPVCNPTAATNDICGYEMLLGDSNPWQANESTAVLRIMTDGTGPYIGTVTGGHSTSRDVWAGNASFEAIQQAGRSGAHFGDKNFASTTEVGVTAAAFWSSNTASSGVLNAAIKGWEFADNATGFAEWISGGRQQSSCAGSALAPFSGLFWLAAGATFSQLSGTTQTVGSICDNTVVAVLVPSWTRPSDFFGKWFCLRYHVSGLGTTNVSVQIYDPTTNNTNKILDISNLDGTKLRNKKYNRVEIQAYNNAGEINQTQDSSQGFDNVHVRRGEPVTCQQIGFP